VLATALRMGAHALKRGGAPLGEWCKTRAAFDPTTLGNRALMHQRKERALRKPGALHGYSRRSADAGAVAGAGAGVGVGARA